MRAVSHTQTQKPFSQVSRRLSQIDCTNCHTAGHTLHSWPDSVDSSDGVEEMEILLKYLQSGSVRK